MSCRDAVQDADTSDAIDTLRAETVERPPASDEGIPPSKTYAPLSFPVIVLLMPASVFGVLARLGLVALMNYDGHAVFPLRILRLLAVSLWALDLGSRHRSGRCMLLRCPCDKCRLIGYPGMGRSIRLLRQV
jgi:hypothetical protein